MTTYNAHIGWLRAKEVIFGAPSRLLPRAARRTLACLLQPPSLSCRRRWRRGIFPFLMVGRRGTATRSGGAQFYRTVRRCGGRAGTMVASWVGGAGGCSSGVSRLRRVSYGAWSSAAVSTTSSAASVASGDDGRGWLELGRWGVRWGELEALGWVLPCEN